MDTQKTLFKLLVFAWYHFACAYVNKNYPINFNLVICFPLSFLTKREVTSHEIIIYRSSYFRQIYCNIASSCIFITLAAPLSALPVWVIQLCQFAVFYSDGNMVGFICKHTGHYTHWCLQNSMSVVTISYFSRLRSVFNASLDRACQQKI